MRDSKIDSIKGILIILVVLAHFQGDKFHDIVFLFHMPLFFMISGYLFKQETSFDRNYIRKVFSRYLLPYFAYSISILVILDRDFSLRHLMNMAYGGRALDGTYWYITCLVFSLCLFAIIKNRFYPRTTILIILAGGGIAIVESMLVRKIDFLRFPGIPWNLDVSLLALVYIAIGFYGKRIIRSLLYCHNYVYDIGGIILILVLSIFCYFNNGGSNTWYYFDMKSVKYNELILAVIIPCMFGFVICRIVYWICIKNAIYSGFAFLGRMTIPVMYLHVPLNQWMNEIGYGRLLYLLIGIGVPVVLTVLLSRFRTMRLLFALPKLQNK